MPPRPGLMGARMAQVSLTDSPTRGPTQLDPENTRNARDCQQRAGPSTGRSAATIRSIAARAAGAVNVPATCPIGRATADSHGLSRSADSRPAGQRPGVAVWVAIHRRQCRPGRTGQGPWSRLNRSGQPRPELLMRRSYAITLYYECGLKGDLSLTQGDRYGTSSQQGDCPRRPWTICSSLRI